MWFHEITSNSNSIFFLNTPARQELCQRLPDGHQLKDVNNTKKTQYHKMVYGLTPLYLNTFLTPKHNKIHQYPTCHGHYYSDIKCHKNHYMKSFLTSTTRLWIICSKVFIKTYPCLISKAFIYISNTHLEPKLFYNGTCKYKIVHARLRLECSSLYANLYSWNVVNSPVCNWWNRNTSTFLHWLPYLHKSP